MDAPPTAEFLPSLQQVPIWDVHEHHIPEILNRRDVGLLDLFQQSYAGWTQARPYCLPGESRSEDPMLAPATTPSWERLVPYVDGSGSNAFVRNLEKAVLEIYLPGETRINEWNWKQLDENIRKHHADPGWTAELLRRCHLKGIITDPYTDPLLNAPRALGSAYRSVCRINAFAVGWNPSNPDHNGNSVEQFARKLGKPCSSFSDLEKLMEHLVATLGDRRQVALKNALAYDRSIQFDAASAGEARSLWKKTNPSPAEQKIWGDWVVNRFCELAAAGDIPMQMHLGSALIRGSHPMHAAGLIERHPRTRFLLMHLAYPWSADLLGMAFVYRNIWIDLTWSFILSPSHFKRALHEAIEILPDESRMMLGGDNWHAEETYGTMRAARQLIGEVLSEKVHSGYFAWEDARRMARRIFFENAEKFFGLSEDSVVPPSPPTPSARKKKTARGDKALR